MRSRWMPLSLAAFAVLWMGAVAALSAPKGKKPGRDTPVKVTFATMDEDITSDGSSYQNEGGVRAVLLSSSGHLLLDTRGADPERALNLNFDASNAFTVPVYMIVALVDPTTQTDVEGSLAGMKNGDEGFVRVVLNFGHDIYQYRFRMGPNPLADLPIEDTNYVAVTCDEGDPCTHWTFSSVELRGRLFRFWSSKGKGRLDQMEEVDNENGDGEGFEMTYGFTIGPPDEP